MMYLWAPPDWHARLLSMRGRKKRKQGEDTALAGYRQHPAVNLLWLACLAASRTVEGGKEYSITILAHPESVGFSLKSLT